MRSSSDQDPRDHHHHHHETPSHQPLDWKRGIPNFFSPFFAFDYSHFLSVSSGNDVMQTDYLILFLGADQPTHVNTPDDVALLRSLFLSLFRFSLSPVFWSAPLPFISFTFLVNEADYLSILRLFLFIW